MGGEEQKMEGGGGNIQNYIYVEKDKSKWLWDILVKLNSTQKNQPIDTIYIYIYILSPCPTPSKASYANLDKIMLWQCTMISNLVS